VTDTGTGWFSGSAKVPATWVGAAAVPARVGAATAVGAAAAAAPVGWLEWVQSRSARPHPEPSMMAHGIE